LEKAVKVLSLGEFVAQLALVKVMEAKAERDAVRRGVEMIAQEAKDIIGTEYAGWPELADSTVARKQAKGQTGRISATDPEFATGELRASIGSQAEGLTGAAGTADPVAVYQEYGTSRMPPRSIFASAGHRKAIEVANAMGNIVAEAIAGKASS
jgi:HK97 gp10 family phage protein